MTAAIVELPRSAPVALNYMLLMQVDEGMIARLVDPVDVLVFLAEGAGVGIALVGNGQVVACVSAIDKQVKAGRQGSNEGFLTFVGKDLRPT